MCFNPEHLIPVSNAQEPKIVTPDPLKKISVGLSLDKELADWALDNARALGFRNRNVMIEELLRSHRAGTKPIRQPNAFPGESSEY
jgi:hypothetical protein